MSDVPVVPPGEQPRIWGTMNLHGSLGSTLRIASIVWRRDSAHLVTYLPGSSVLEVEEPGGGAIGSGVSLPPIPRIDRQAGQLYETSAAFQAATGGIPRAGNVIGMDQLKGF